MRRTLVPPLDLGRELLDRRKRLLERRSERRARLLAERLLQAARRHPERIQVGGRGEARLGLERLLELERSRFRLLDPFRGLPPAQVGKGGPQRGEIAPAGRLLRDLAECGERRGVVDDAAALDRRAEHVEGEPRMGALLRLVCAEVDDPRAERLGGENARDALTGRRKGGRDGGDALEIVAQRHRISI